MQAAANCCGCWSWRRLLGAHINRQVRFIFKYCRGSYILFMQKCCCIISLCLFSKFSFKCDFWILLPFSCSSSRAIFFHPSGSLFHCPPECRFKYPPVSFSAKGSQGTMHARGASHTPRNPAAAVPHRILLLIAYSSVCQQPSPNISTFGLPRTCCKLESSESLRNTASPPSPPHQHHEACG
jgi:hypothetical protein